MSLARRSSHALFHSFIDLAKQLTVHKMVGQYELDTSFFTRCASKLQIHFYLFPILPWSSRQRVENCVQCVCCFVRQFAILVHPMCFWSILGVRSSRSTCSPALYHIGFKLALSPVFFQTAYTDRNELLFTMHKKKHSHPGAYSHLSSNKISSNVRSHKNPALASRT